jgi:hypothetical protein
MTQSSRNTRRRRLPVLSAVALLLALAAPAGAQQIRGRVLDSSNGMPVPLTGVWLLDGERGQVDLAMADSLGRYFLTVPDSGEYFIVAERFGYFETASPLLAIAGTRDYDLDLELRPEPLRVEGLDVTVRNEQVSSWVQGELGLLVPPQGIFGFRVLQGERLTEAKTRARFDPTETLRWLYIPVSHGRCVSINATPRAERIASAVSGVGSPAFGEGAATGTVAREDLMPAPTSDPDACNGGSLWVNDRRVPNEHVDRLDMSRIAVVVTLPSMVRMYTYDFDWAFR